MSTNTVRQRVLGLIERRGEASAAEIARALSMSAAAVRHHLAILLSDGRIVMERSEGTGHRGRPVRVYRISDRVLGENLAPLVGVLLDAHLAGAPEAERGNRLNALGEELAGRAGGIDRSAPATKRLVEVTARLNAMNYRARWEAGARGPRMVLGHCPYAAIIDGHPELCRLDASLLEALTGAPVEQLTKFSRQPGGPAHCVFAVQQGAAAD